MKKSKLNIKDYAKHNKALRKADQELLKVREKHLRELREADLSYHKLQTEMNKVHFDQLNENAKRTIEERGHFLPVEVFEPFRDSVTKELASRTGGIRSTEKTLYYIITAISILFAGIMAAIALLK